MFPLPHMPLQIPSQINTHTQTVISGLFWRKQELNQKSYQPGFMGIFSSSFFSGVL
jgi:hypothetical protein